jgi:hypothetical protein
MEERNKGLCEDGERVALRRVGQGITCLLAPAKGPNVDRPRKPAVSRKKEEF